MQQKFGCKAGWKVHKSSNEHLINNGGVAPWRPNFGRHGLPQDTIQAVQRFLLANSRISSSRTTDKAPEEYGNPVSVRHLNDTISALYLNYAYTDNPTLCESKFRWVVEYSKIYTDAFQDTDMCDYCISNIFKKKRVKMLYEEYEEYLLINALNNVDDEHKIDIDMLEESDEKVPVLHDGNNIQKFIYPL